MEAMATNNRVRAYRGRRSGVEFLAIIQHDNVAYARSSHLPALPPAETRAALAIAATDKVFTLVEMSL